MRVRYAERNSPVLSPELLKVLAEMGHGDTLVIGDANFAAASMAKDSILIRCDGVKATDLMDAILTLLPWTTLWTIRCSSWTRTPATPIWSARCGTSSRPSWPNTIPGAPTPAP